MEQELTYEEALAKSIEWKHKADQATTAVLKSARATVALEYDSLAAEIMRRTRRRLGPLRPLPL